MNFNNFTILESKFTTYFGLKKRPNFNTISESLKKIELSEEDTLIFRKKNPEDLMNIGLLHWISSKTDKANTKKLKKIVELDKFNETVNEVGMSNLNDKEKLYMQINEST